MQLFDAGIDILTDRQQYRVNYDTPYIRNLPSRLEIVDSSDTETRTENFGPSYEDPFRIELDAFHDCVVNGTRPLTSGADAVRDIALCQAIIESHLTGRAIDHPTERA